MKWAREYFSGRKGAPKMCLEILSQYAKNEDNCKRGAIVFVHGAYQGAWCWKEFFMPYFSRIGYDCYALSLRGGAREK